MKNPINRLSISTQLVLLLSGLTVLLTLFLAGVLDSLFATRIQQEIGRQLAELAIQTNDKLDRSLFERHREIQGLANKAELGNSDIPPDTKRRLLEDMQESYSFYAWLGITDNSGQVLIAASRLLEGVNVANRPWFTNALDGIHLTDVHDAVLLSKLLRPAGAEPMRFVDVSFPYRDREGRIAGVFGAHLSFDWAEEIEKSVLLPLLRRNGVETLILSKDLAVILGPKELVGSKLALPAIATQAAAPVGYAVEQFADGKSYLFGFSTSQGYDASPNLGWTVLVRQDIDAAYAPVTEFRRQVVLAGLGIALLFAALGYLLAKRISRPLCQIAESAQQIESGAIHTIAHVDGGYREIGILSASLQSLIGKLQANEASVRQAERRKDEFLATLAHELRNPLAPISAAASLLSLSSPDEKQQHLGEVISRQARHMTGLIDDLLDVSRVTRGLVTLQAQPIDMLDVVVEAVEQIRPLLEVHAHQFESRLPQHAAMVCGDRKRLVQVIANLLNNAARYTPRGGEIVLTLSMEEDRVVVSVRDNGIGMSPGLMEHAFELFTQATRKTDRSQGGLGVGLALAKNLVQLHGGTLSVQSGGENLGSEFVVSLPALAPALQPSQATAAQAEALAAASSLRVLVVDDNVDAADTLALLVDALGHQTSVVYRPEAAIASAAVHRPQVCLLDIGMPGMDGYELAQHLRTLPAMKGALLIAVTGYGQQQDREKALQAGFDEFLVKPFNFAKLSELLNCQARQCQDAA